MTSIWSKLTATSTGVLAAWGNFPAQFLTPVESLAAAVPCDRGHACQLRIVEHGPDDVVGVCTNEDGLCHKRQVTKQERVVYRLDEVRLFEAIIHAVDGTRAPPEEIAARPRVVRIAGIPTTGDKKLPVFFFALVTDLAATDDAVTALLAYGAEKFLLVIPEEKSIGIVQQNRAAQRGARIFGLDQLLEVSEKGAVSARASGQEALQAWVGKVAPSAERDAEAARFPTPPGTTWKDVTITFKERDIVEIKCGKERAVTKERLHIPGMADTTRREKTPTDKWFLLMAFASRGPALSMMDLERLYRSTNRAMIKKQKSDLSSALRAYFGIEAEPIPYRRGERCYRPELQIREDDNLVLEDRLTDR